MSLKIVRDKSFLHKASSPVLTVAEGEEIAEKLFSVWRQSCQEGITPIGLSANQIGILKRVSIICIPNQLPITLMNPEVVDVSRNEHVIYQEGCLSIPGKMVHTNRFQRVDVSTLNHANVLKFGPEFHPITNETISKDYELLKSICVQHEIDHLNGILMTDDGVRYVIPSVKGPIKHGRNDKVMIEKDGLTQFLKYKKALELIQTEGWKLI